MVDIDPFPNTLGVVVGGVFGVVHAVRGALACWASQENTSAVPRMKEGSKPSVHIETDSKD